MKENKRKISQQDILKLIGFPSLTFIIGFVGVWIFSQFNNSNDIEDAQPQKSIATIENTQAKKENSNFDRQVRDFMEQLESDNLLYVYVDNMYNWLQDSINASNCDSIFIKRVKGYHDIVQLLREGEIQKVIDYQNVNNVLSEDHLWQIRAAYKGWRDESGEHEYDTDGSDNAKSQFERDYKDIVSFREIYLIHEGKTEKKK